MAGQIRATGEIQEEIEGTRDALRQVRQKIAEAGDRYDRGVEVERRLVNREADLREELIAARARLEAETEQARRDSYRAQVRETMQKFSDQALAYQDSIIRGGIDREECDREIMRREDERARSRDSRSTP